MIDWSRIQELRDEVGQEDFAEVVELFLEETEGVLERLAQCGETSEQNDLIHFVKGSALNLGFPALSDLCLQIERGEVVLDVPNLLSIYRASKLQLTGGMLA